MPKEKQGYSYSVNVDLLGRGRGGPFRFEYVLTSEFFIFEDQLPNNLEKGHSYLKLTEAALAVQVGADYRWHLRGAEKRHASVRFQCHEGTAQRIIVEIQEDDIDTASAITADIVHNILDGLAFIKRVPLQVRHVDVYPLRGNVLLRRYLTFNYGPGDVDEGQLTAACNPPDRLRPCLRHFHEALKSVRPHLRLISLWNAYDALNDLRRRDDAEILREGKQPRRDVPRVPDEQVFAEHFPQSIGTRGFHFLDGLRAEFRKHVAHPNLNESQRLEVDPARSLSAHRVDWTNEAVIRVLWELIRAEWALIAQHRLPNEL